MGVAKQIKDMMKEKGMNQRQLADACGLSCGTISEVLKMRKKISKKTLSLIANALSTTIDELIERR